MGFHLLSHLKAVNVNLLLQGDEFDRLDTTMSFTFSSILAVLSCLIHVGPRAML